MASAGLCVEHSHQQSLYILATARDPPTVGVLADMIDIEILKLDVCVPETMMWCKEMVAQRIDGRLGVLVNNAGIESDSSLLDIDITEAKRLYDVNVYGPLAMVQAFAPLLIEAKGVIFNQSLLMVS